MKRRLSQLDPERFTPTTERKGTADYADFANEERAVQICVISNAIFRLLMFLASNDVAKGPLAFAEHRNKFQNGLDSKPPIGGVPRPGSGGRRGRNLRHRERRRRLRPRQITPARA